MSKLGTMSEVRKQVQLHIDKLVESGAERGKNRLTNDFNAAKELSEIVSNALRRR